MLRKSFGRISLVVADEDKIHPRIIFKGKILIDFGMLKNVRILTTENLGAYHLSGKKLILQLVELHCLVSSYRLADLNNLAN